MVVNVTCSLVNDPARAEREIWHTTMRKPSERSLVTRNAATMKGPRQYCNREHSSRHNAHQRRHPELPRPLIVEQLRGRLLPGPLTYDRAERLGRDFGATDAEIVEALEQGS